MLPARSPIARRRNTWTLSVGDGELYRAAGPAPHTFHDGHRDAAHLTRREVEWGREHDAANRIDQMAGAEESCLAASLDYGLALPRA